MTSEFGLVAQLAELVTLNDGVEGSIPSESTTARQMEHCLNDQQLTENLGRKDGNGCANRNAVANASEKRSHLEGALIKLSRTTVWLCQYDIRFDPGLVVYTMRNREEVNPARLITLKSQVRILLPLLIIGD